ncbi:MAG: glycosyltransferase family 9 protein [Deltaproteobacteria bacterium]|jgi:ADP-heptose:LPS heptosyltransferase|nr:glycosyltransferase family 9 protein [Deltaproteobacteria bacterium]
MGVVVVEAQKLGDFIQSTPLINALIAEFGESELTFLVKENAVKEALKLYFPTLHSALFSFEDPINYFKFKKPSLLINLSISPQVLALAELLEPKEIRGPRKDKGVTFFPVGHKIALATMSVNRRLDRLNLVDIWRCLSPLSLPTLPKPHVKELPPHLAEKLTDDPTLPWICFQMGAQNHLRRWSAENHALLASQLAQLFPFKPILLGTRQEKALALKFQEFFFQNTPQTSTSVKPAIITGETNLEELAAIISKSALLVASDTGVAHLGASLGIPQLSVFMGPAFCHETGPYNPRAYVIQGMSPWDPCVENKGCQRPSCLAEPKAKHALPLALLAMGKTYTGGEDFPQTIETWTTHLGKQGFSLRPTTPKPALLDLEKKAALIIRESVCELLGQSVKPNDSRVSSRDSLELKDELKLYTREENFDSKHFHEDIAKKILQSLTFIAQKGTNTQEEKKLFLDKAQSLLFSTELF